MPRSRDSKVTPLVSREELFSAFDRARNERNTALRKLEKLRVLAVKLRDEASGHPWTSRECELLARMLRMLGER